MSVTYAEVLNNVVRYIGTKAFLPNMPLPFRAVNLAGVTPQPSVGDLYDPATGEFSTPTAVVIPPRLDVSLSADVIAPGGSISWSAQATDPDDTVNTSVNATFWIPIMKGGTQLTVLKITLASGIASGSQVVPQAGFYELLVSQARYVGAGGKIRPVPANMLGGDVQLIVES